MSQIKRVGIMKTIMTGISYMIPMVVAGGILGALAKSFGGWQIGDFYKATAGTWATPFSGMEPFTWGGFWWGVNMLGTYAMNFAVAILCAYMAFAIAERPGIVPGFIIGYVCTMSKAGFIGGLLMGFAVGYFILWMKTWKLPKWCSGLMPVLIIPVLSTFICGMLFLCVFAQPLAFVMDVFQRWIASLNGGSKAVIGAVIGACMGFDLGGPINKTASMAANGLGTDGVYGPMSAKIIGGMTPPIGAFVASLIARKKFTTTERDTALTAFPMGLCFITEGVLPFAAGDPVHFIPASMIGSAAAGAIAVGMGVESMAGHGGVFVIPAMANPLWAVIALIVGSLITGIIYAIIKKSPDEVETVEEQVTDNLDISF